MAGGGSVAGGEAVSKADDYRFGSAGVENRCEETKQQGKKRKMLHI
jgi:hypothetical protein